jgi:RNA polymerase sigma-70 factor (ECF subfamily)
MRLIEKILEGGTHLFEILMLKERVRVYRLALSLLKNHADAEDVTQETFIQAFRHLENFRGESAVSTWLYRICLNLSLNCRQKQKQQLDRCGGKWEESEDWEEGWNWRLTGDDPSAQLEQKELFQNVARLLDLMPSQFANALLLQALDGCTCSEISEISAISVNTVRSRIFRAREFLFDRLPHCRPQRPNALLLEE